jgi:hypothetical protein
MPNMNHANVRSIEAAKRGMAAELGRLQSEQRRASMAEVYLYMTTQERQEFAKRKSRIESLIVLLGRDRRAA